MYADNALFFPTEAVSALRTVRGAAWCALVERLMTLPTTHEEPLALTLMMIRLNGCMSCETDSYRAMRGCSGCAVQTLRRYKGDDAELLALYGQALDDVRRFAQSDARAATILAQKPA
jgi:hypothetical protein